MITSLEGVARYFCGNRSGFGRDQWRISAAIAMRIARLTANYDGISDEVLEYMVRESGAVLMGQPVIIDDTVDGLLLEPMGV